MLPEKFRKEWLEEKNTLSFDSASPGGHQKVWWRCTSNHIWDAVIKNRVMGGTGCPYCSNKAAWPGYNDLATTDPEIANEWDFDLNEFTPNLVTRGSKKIAFWRCSQNHSWSESIGKRTLRGVKCHYCENKRLLTNFNDLRTRFPKLAKEWNSAANLVTPEEVLPEKFGLTKQAVWQCTKGHSWSASIKQRLADADCGYCSGRLAIPGETDLSTTHPELIKEWSFAKNTISIETVLARHTFKVWWICKNGHEWLNSPSRRVNENQNCATCSNRKLLPGFNDLATVLPELAGEWHPTRNVLLPTEVIWGKKVEAWWLGACGHEWPASLYNRAFKGSGCPFCSGNLLLPGFNDLATLRPDLLQFWDYEKNKITPDQVLLTNKEVWWKCKRGHSWRAHPPGSTRKLGCQSCSSGYSSFEKIVCDYIREICDYELKLNGFPLVLPNGNRQQLDIQIPELKIAFEVQDFASHSRTSDDEDGMWKLKKKGPLYHEAKKCMTQEQLGFALYEIWEDEIKDGSFKERLRRVLGDRTSKTER